MNYYDVLSSDGMRCIQQKGLLKLWERLRGEFEFPQFKSLPVESLQRSFEKIMFCDVEYPTHEPRFRIVYHGHQYERMYNQNCVDKFLDEVIPPALKQQAMHSYFDVAANRRPYFTMSTVRNADGPEISYERLLLPFSIKSNFVQRIVCMVTLFTEANGFDLSDISSDKLETV